MAVTLPPEVSLQGSTLEFLTKGPKRLLIGNEWVQAASGETFETVNPATGERLAEVALAGPEDIDKAVQAARQAFESGPWSKLNGEERGQMLWKLADLIEANAQELAELETLDNGKPIRVSLKGDLPAAVKHFRYYAGWAGK